MPQYVQQLVANFVCVPFGALQVDGLLQHFAENSCLPAETIADKSSDWIQTQNKKIAKRYFKAP